MTNDTVISSIKNQCNNDRMAKLVTKAHDLIEISIVSDDGTTSSVMFLDHSDLNLIKNWILSRTVELVGFKDDVVIEYIIDTLRKDQKFDINLMGKTLSRLLNTKSSDTLLKELNELLINISKSKKSNDIVTKLAVNRINEIKAKQHSKINQIIRSNITNVDAGKINKDNSQNKLDYNTNQSNISKFLSNDKKFNEKPHSFWFPLINEKNPFYGKSSASIACSREKFTWLDEHNHYKSRNKNKNLPIVLLGDSIIKNLENYESVTKKIFTKKSILNHGIGGDRTEHILWRIKNDELPKETDILILHCGINNINVNKEDEIVTAIKAIIFMVRQLKPKVSIIVSGLLPLSNMDELRIKKIDQINKSLDEMIGQQYGYFNVWFLMPDNDWVEENGQLSAKYFSPDSNQLNHLGCEKFCFSIQRRLSIVLKIIESKDHIDLVRKQLKRLANSEKNLLKNHNKSKKQSSSESSSSGSDSSDCSCSCSCDTRSSYSSSSTSSRSREKKMKELKYEPSNKRPKVDQITDISKQTTLKKSFKTSSWVEVASQNIQKDKLNAISKHPLYSMVEEKTKGNPVFNEKIRFSLDKNDPAFDIVTEIRNDSNQAGIRQSRNCSVNEEKNLFEKTETVKNSLCNNSDKSDSLETKLIYYGEKINENALMKSPDISDFKNLNYYNEKEKLEQHPIENLSQTMVSNFFPNSAIVQSIHTSNERNHMPNNNLEKNYIDVCIETNESITLDKNIQTEKNTDSHNLTLTSISMEKVNILDQHTEDHFFRGTIHQFDEASNDKKDLITEINLNDLESNHQRIKSIKSKIKRKIYKRRQMMKNLSDKSIDDDSSLKSSTASRSTQNNSFYSNPLVSFVSELNGVIENLEKFKNIFNSMSLLNSLNSNQLNPFANYSKQKTSLDQSTPLNKKSKNSVLSSTQHLRSVGKRNKNNLTRKNCERIGLNKSMP